MAKIPVELAKSLHDIGVRYVFGIPGGPTIPYMEAMRQQGIKVITTANEQSAGMMADVFGRLTGVPGVCHATFGPGATNLSTGIGGAYLDRSPLIALTSEMADENLGRKIQMNVDHQALLKPVTKWTTRLSKGNFSETLKIAVKTATTEMPGPVHIGVPVDIYEDEVDPVGPIDINTQGSEKLPQEALLEKAKKLIENAEKPLLAVGLTAFRLGLHENIRNFAHKHQLPVVLTPMAKGIIDQEDPCYAGVLFHARCDFVAETYRAADLVIGLGYDSIEFNYEAWMPNVPLIHIDSEPVDIPSEYTEVCDITGNIEKALDYLNSLELNEFSWDLKEVEINKKMMFEALVPYTGTFTVSDATIVTREVLPDNSILTCDVGAHTHLLGQLWNTTESGRLIMTNGWSTMGFGIPSAIGAKLCCPSRPVVCITGDGAFLMNCGDLVVAKRENLNVVIIVYADKDYSLIKVKQAWKGVDQYATFVQDSEFFDADKFLGIPVLKVNDKASLKEALEKSLDAEGPMIIEALVDGSIYQDLIIKDYK
jgi:acetolactate synthase I/II/III large subunit